MARVPVLILAADPATGNAIAGASATVKNRATGATVTLYTGEVGATTIANPLVTDAYGRAQAWADRAAFRIDYTASGLTAWSEYRDIGPSSDAGVDAVMASAVLGQPMGLTGATAATRYVGATTGGAPATGTFAIGDFIIDRTGKVFVCTVAGTPGTWVQVGGSTTLASLGMVRGVTGVLTTGTNNTVTHSLGTTPNVVLLQPKGVNAAAGTWFADSFAANTFNISHNYGSSIQYQWLVIA